MRLTVSPEQLKFFHLKGYLELENLISVEEVARLVAAIDALKSKSPGYPDENCFRSIPLIVTLARKKGWGQIAADLLHKKPLRIVSDKFTSHLPINDHPLGEDDCGFVLDLTTRSGIFFKNILSDQLSSREKSHYLFLVLTARHLPEELNPWIVR